MSRRLTVLQMLPALESGGVERGTVEIAAALVRAGHRALVMSAGGRLVPELEALGAEHIELPVGRKSLLTFRHVPRVGRLLREEGVDVLHLRSRLPAWVGWHAWRGLPADDRPRLVTTVHGFYTVGRYSSVMTRGERVIAVSESVREYILAHYPRVAPERIQVIHRGVRREFYPRGYRPTPEWLAAWYGDHPLLEDALVITLPGRLTRWKGQEDLIELIARLRSQGLPAVGVMAGGAHPRKQRFVKELRERIRARGLEEAMVMTGHRSDLREIMAASDIVLSLSRDPEAFGRTTVEALSMGRPVIGYAHGGVREQLEAMLPEGLVPVGDVDAVAQRVLEWQRQPPNVREHLPFTLEAMQSATLGLYEALAG